MTDVAVLSAVRTPIGKFLGGLSGVPAIDLGIAAARAALERSGVPPEDVGETIFGMARQAGSGPNPGRQVAIGAGVPDHRPAYTVNKACASGLKSVALGAAGIRTGEAQFVLAGGMESMSRAPYLLTGARTGYRLGDAAIHDVNYKDGFECPLAGELMGSTAETVADRWGIGRAEQDEYAARSQKLAAAAWEEGRFAAEVVAVEAPGRKGTVVIEKDEHLRPGTDAARLAKLPPVFRAGGTVHAGNSSGITDGACALVLASGDEVDARGLSPLGWIAGAAVAGVDPKIMGIGPVPATQQLFSRLGWTIEDVDLVELNEAFAAQVLAVAHDLDLSLDRTNVNGGAIALGHPIGATGARILATLLHEMRRREVARGLATLCVSGGMGFSMAVTRERPGA